MAETRAGAVEGVASGVVMVAMVDLPPAPRDTSTATRLLLACGIVGPVAFWALSIAAMLSWPGYDPVSDSISGLIYAPEGWLQVDAFILLAVLTMAFAVGLGRVAGATPADRSAVRAALLVLAAWELGFALFPANTPGGSSFHGTAHMVVLGTFALAFPVLSFRIGRVLRRDDPWRRAGTLTFAVTLVMAVAIVGVVLTVAGPLDPWTGVLERIWVAVPSLWLVGLAVHGLLVSAGHFSGPRPQA